MSSRRNATLLRYKLEAIPIFLLYGFFSLFPLDMASAMGGWLLKTLGPRVGSRKRILSNIALAFPEKSHEEHLQILVGMWENLGRVMAEYPHLAEFKGDRVEIVGEELLEEFNGKHTPALVISGHFANWEVMPVTSANLGFTLQLIYRQPNNPYVARLLIRARLPGGKKMARKGVEGARSVHAALKNNDMVGMLIDQKHNRGRAIPFFNRPAMTAPAVAELAMQYNAPIVLCRIERIKGAYFRLTILPPLSMPQEMEKDAAVDDILIRLNQQIENWVRERPEQWLWLHRRWGE